MRSTLTTIAWLSLSASVLVACDTDRAERADDGSSGEMTESSADPMVDEAQLLERAQRYASDLVQLSEGPEFEETHADAAAVQVWGSPEAADDFHSIDPDDPTQAIEFDPGTLFVKEHLDEEGTTTGMTFMYKAEPGYDPESGDWYWARVDGETVTDSGRVAWCRNCHAAAHNSDFVVGFGKSP